MSEDPEPIDDGTALIMHPDIDPAGAYANGFGIWGTPIDFTLDFLAGPLAPDDSTQIIVARVRLPPQTVAGLIMALEAALDEHVSAQDLAGVPTDGKEEPS